ncbi:MAG: hypothetical protein ACERKO_04135 [Acetanaerobacterium sp.]
MIKRTFLYGLVIAIISTVLSACSPIDTVSNTSSPDISESTATYFEAQFEPDSTSKVESQAPDAAEKAVGFEVMITELGDYELPPINYGIGFNHGTRRIKINGAWEYVDQDKNVLPYDYMRWFSDTIPFSIVQKSGKYGVVNAAFRVIVPIEYDQIFQAYKNGELGCVLTDSVLYVLKDGKWSAIDIKNRMQVSFVPKSQEDEPSYLFSDFDVIAYNGATQYVKYHGEQTTLALELLFPAFDHQSFQLYKGAKFAGEYQAELIIGDYEDEIKFNFNHQGDDLVAIRGDIKPIEVEAADPETVMKHMPESDNEKLNPMLPMQALKLADTEILLSDFYLIDDQEISYHVFALSTPENHYREVLREHHPDVNPLSEVLFVGKDRNQEYSVLFKASDSGGYHISFFQFQE